LTIANALRGERPELVFVGTGIAHELAKRSRVFDEIVLAPPDTARARQVVRSGDGLVAVMDREYFLLARDADIPVFAVDSLFWLRQPVPDLFRAAHRAWVQDFEGVRERLRQTRVRAEIVGPIVPAHPHAPRRSDRLLVLNLGGGESPYTSPGMESAYPDLVVRALLASDLAASFDRRMVLIAGQRLVERLASAYPSCGIDFRSVSHDESASLLGAATIVVTSPGLTTSLECFQLSTPTYFLPPQNSSQWWILDTFRRRRLAPISLHWADLQARRPVPKLAPQAIREAIVREIVSDLAPADEVAGRLSQVMSRIAHASHDELARRQHDYFESLGANGATMVARALVSPAREARR
jgi:hypothetical protein